MGSERACSFVYLILNHTPQDGCSIRDYNPKLWTSITRINAQFVVWTTLREQIFHKHKIDARGSIRKAPNVMSWYVALEWLRNAGDKDAGAIIKAWNTIASKQQKLGGARLRRSNIYWNVCQ